MSLPLKAICSAKRVRRDGTSLIFIQYCYSAVKRTLLNTGIGIPPQFWNKRKECVSNSLPPAYGKSEQLNEEIRRMVRLADDIITFATRSEMEDPLEFVKQTFHPQYSVKDLKNAGHEKTAGI